MKTIYQAILLVLAGCGMPNPLEFAQPTGGCLGPYRADGRLSAEALLENEATLKRLFTSGWYDTVNYHEPLLHSDREFCNSFGGIRITYQAESIPCNAGTCEGMTDPWTGIHLQADGAVLLHELLHVYETERGVLDSYEHPKWASKGYQYLNNAIWNQARVDVREAP